ncbi:hypothetical protein PULV_b0200 [Pseudoalteromonas ulvae UL12]|nr:hypothetical protein [Pseudoalteromonas ulvae UL12]
MGRFHPKAILALEVESFTGRPSRRLFLHRLRHFMQKQSPSCAPFSLAF